MAINDKILAWEGGLQIKITRMPSNDKSPAREQNHWSCCTVRPTTGNGQSHRFTTPGQITISEIDMPLQMCHTLCLSIKRPGKTLPLLDTLEWDVTDVTRMTSKALDINAQHAPITTCAKSAIKTMLSRLPIPTITSCGVLRPQSPLQTW